jgi:hypothetical protein
MASVVAIPALRLAVAAAGYFLVNTLAVALVISLTESVTVIKTWAELFQLSFPYLVASAGVAGLTLVVGQEIGWQAPLALLPIMLGVYSSYRRYFAATAPEASANVRMEAGSAAAGAHI